MKTEEQIRACIEALAKSAVGIVAKGDKASGHSLESMTAFAGMAEHIAMLGVLGWVLDGSDEDFPTYVRKPFSASATAKFITKAMDKAREP